MEIRYFYILSSWKLLSHFSTLSFWFFRGGDDWGRGSLGGGCGGEVSFGEEMAKEVVADASEFLWEVILGECDC